MTEPLSALDLRPAQPAEFTWCQAIVTKQHYLRRPVDPRSRPLAYVVTLAGERFGCLLFGRPQATCCYQGGLTYGSTADVAGGRACYDRWEVLNLARVWLDPRIQAGGDLCKLGVVPSFTDRAGVWRPCVASAVIRAALARVGADYLTLWPPCFVNEPYAVRAVLSYCDTRRHRGTIYRAAGFRLARRNDHGMETWWTDGVAPLSPAEDRLIRHRSATDPRAAIVRRRGATEPALFETVADRY